MYLECSKTSPVLLLYISILIGCFYRLVSSGRIARKEVIYDHDSYTNKIGRLHECTLYSHCHSYIIVEEIDGSLGGMGGGDEESYCSKFSGTS